MIALTAYLALILPGGRPKLSRFSLGMITLSTVLGAGAAACGPDSTFGFDGGVVSDSSCNAI